MKKTSPSKRGRQARKNVVARKAKAAAEAEAAREARRRRLAKRDWRMPGKSFIAGAELAMVLGAALSNLSVSLARKVSSDG